jgi:hypothetical protein
MYVYNVNTSSSVEPISLEMVGHAARMKEEFSSQNASCETMSKETITETVSWFT